MNGASRFPHLESDSLIAAMTDEQKFVFDLKGWLLVPSVLNTAQVEEIREFILQLHRDRTTLPDVDRYSLSGPAQVLLDHPAITGILEEVLGHNRTPDSYGFRCENSFTAIRHAGQPLEQEAHGGGNNVSPLFSYQCKNGSIYSGLTRVVWELNPVRRGMGGTVFLSGSHKMNFPRPDHIDRFHPLFESYECPPGSVVFFSEAIVHSGVPWIDPSHPRVAVLNCYSRIDTQFHRLNLPREVIEAMPPRRRTLFRGVWAHDFQHNVANTFFSPDNLSL